jgi:hypothetical protein
MDIGIISTSTHYKLFRDKTKDSIALKTQTKKAD